MILASRFSKNPVGLLAVQRGDQFLLGIGTTQFQACLLNLIFQFQLHLLKQVGHVYVHDIQRDILAAGLADLEKILDQHLQPEGLSLQNLNIILALFLVLFFLQKIDVGYDRRQRSLQVMDDIGDSVPSSCAGSLPLRPPLF